MTITRVKLENFTVFENLDLEPSPGINALVGANGTGKTHLMKVCYAACYISKFLETIPFIRKLGSVCFFRQITPENRLGRLVNRVTVEIRAARIEGNSLGISRNRIAYRSLPNQLGRSRCPSNGVVERLITGTVRPFRSRLYPAKRYAG